MAFPLWTATGTENWLILFPILDLHPLSQIFQKCPGLRTHCFPKSPLLSGKKKKKRPCSWKLIFLKTAWLFDFDIPNLVHCFSACSKCMNFEPNLTSLCLQKASLFVACICHDLDHRGTNSAFLTKTGSPLADLYGNPIIENHHFNQTLALLQIDDLNIFSKFSEQNYFQVFQ